MPIIADATNARWDRSFFGHPRSLSTLFLYRNVGALELLRNARPLLILFMTATVAHGGLGFPTSKAGAIYGLYTTMIYSVQLPGADGWRI